LKFSEYKPWKGPIPGRNNGVLISKFQERSTGYSIDKLQDRGTFFIEPGEDVYAGQIVAEHIKPGDLVVNVTEAKRLQDIDRSKLAAAIKTEREQGNFNLYRFVAKY